MFVMFTSEEAEKLTPEELEALIEKRRREREERERYENADCGGTDAWSATHPCRQLHITECENSHRLRDAGADALANRGFLR